MTVTNYWRSNWDAKKRALAVGAECDYKACQIFYKTAADWNDYIGKVRWHVDHIIPLHKGGNHVPSNLQLLPAMLNHMKHSHSEATFLRMLAVFGIDPDVYYRNSVREITEDHVI